MKGLRIYLYDANGKLVNDPQKSIEYATGLEWQTMWPRGYGQASFTVRRAIADRWEAAGAREMVVRDGLAERYRGVLAGPEREWAEIGPSIRMEANGWYGVLAKRRIRKRWIDLAAFMRCEQPTEATDTTQASFLVEKGEGRLQVRLSAIDELWRAGTERYRLLYSAPAGTTIRRVKFNYKRQGGRAAVVVYNVDTGTNEWTAPVRQNDAGSADQTLATPASQIEFRIGPSVAAQYDQNDWVILSDVVVYFTMAGSPAYTYTGKEVIKDILLGVAEISTDFSLIEDPGVELSPLLTEGDGYVTRDEAVQAALRFGDKTLHQTWGLAVWGSEGASDGKPQAELKARRTDDYEYAVKLADLETLSDAEQRDEVWNVVIVKYRDDDGFTRFRTTADNPALEDAESIARYNGRREIEIDCDESSAASADAAGIRFLQAHKGAAFRDSFAVTETITTKSGQRVPASQVQGGERVKIVDYQGGVVYFLKETRYNAETGVLMMTPDATPAAVEAVAEAGTPDTPDITVAVATGGANVSWTAEGHAAYYVVEWASDGSGTDGAVCYAGGALSAFLAYDEVHRYFRVKGVGYDGSESAFGAWTTDTTSVVVPSGVSGTPGAELVFLNVALGTDASHSQTGFRTWEVQRADDGAGTNTVELGTWTPAAGATGSIAQPYAQNWWESRYYRMRAVNWLGFTSTYTTWLSIVSKPKSDGTVSEDFSRYARPDISDLASLWALPLRDFDTDEAWVTFFSGTPSSETTNFKEGNRGLRITPDVGVHIGDAAISIALDLSNDGRFTNDDYACIALYVPNSVAGKTFRLILNTTDPGQFSIDVSPASVGWNYLKIKKSDFAVTAGSDWANVFQIIVTMEGTDDYFIVDDLRVSKADPDDATTYNDTGKVWDFLPLQGAGSEWHVLQGKRTGEPPSADYGLAQLLTAAAPTNWLLAYHTQADIAAGVGIMGTYLKGADGEVGFAFNIQDASVAARTMYVAELDTGANEVRLVSWIAGTRTVIATKAYTSAPNTEYYVAADWRDGDWIKLYVSTSEMNLIAGSKLQIAVQDGTIARGGPIGVVAKECNARFFRVRGGSPEHAQTAEWAALAGEAKITVESPGTSLAAYLALPGLVGFWPMSSVQRSTGNVYDLSGQARTLTYTGNPTFNYLANGVPYIDLDGTGDYLARADETDLDILGNEAIYNAAARGLTLGCWAWLDALAGAGSSSPLITKYANTGNQRSYFLDIQLTGIPRLIVSTDGTATIQVAASVTIAPSGWYFIVGRFVPSTSLDIWVGTANGLVKTTNTTSIPATIANSTTALQIGGCLDLTRYTDGRIARAHLEANAQPDALIESLFQQERALFGV